MFKTILCPFDGSDHARKALELAISMAKMYEAKLIFLHGMLTDKRSDELERFAEIEGIGQSISPVVDELRSVEGRLEYGYKEPPKGSRVYTELGETILNQAKREAQEGGVKDVDTILTSGDTARQILRAIDERGADCVVMGSRGLSDVKAMFLGSVSHKVLNEAPCTCIAVK